MQDVSDSHMYDGIVLSDEMLVLFISALRFYADALANDLAAIRVDPELAKFVDDRSLRSFQITREIKTARDTADRIEKRLPEAQADGDIDLNLSHGLVRRLKAVSLLYISELERRRNDVATGRALTTFGLEVLDSKLLQLRELMTLGVFGRAEPIALIVSPAAARKEPVAAPTVTITPENRIVNIELVDPELRERCLDIFNVFDEADQRHRFDTVIGEATRILEDRVRMAAELGCDLSGVDLMTKAFGSKAARLRVSQNDGEQEGAHLLFRGVFGFIRNPVHHRLQIIERERAVQILAFIDYLLYLTGMATREPAA